MNSHTALIASNTNKNNLRSPLSWAVARGLEEDPIVQETILRNGINKQQAIYRTGRSQGKTPTQTRTQNQPQTESHCTMASDMKNATKPQGRKTILRNIKRSTKTGGEKRTLRQKEKTR